MENKVTAVCGECSKQFEYELKPGYPRKYCFECSAIKKATYENKSLAEPKVPVVKVDGTYVGNNPKVAQSGSKHTTMYVSYAKDIFCALVNNKASSDDFQRDMNCAIELVKQAKEAFE